MLPHAAHTFDTIWGHQVLKDLLGRLVQENRLPHAVLLHGPDGVGKRSLAFALAKLIFSQDVEPDVTLLAPAAAEMRWRFGRAFLAEDDLFGGMDDLFGDLAPEPEPVPKVAVPVPPETATELSKQDEPASPKSSKKSARGSKKEDERAPALAPPVEPDPVAPDLVPLPAKTELRGRAERVAPAPSHRVLLPIDARVDRLVSRSYPLEYDSDDIPIPRGHIDLAIIEPLGRSRSIKVEQARLLQDIALVPPVETRHRVVIVFGADTITASGANSLLKLIEEPPSFLKVILVTDHFHRVLETIRSRCVGVYCAPLQLEELARRLVAEEHVEEDLARVAAALAEGRPGRAAEVLGGEWLRQRRGVFEARLAIERVGLAALPLAVHRALAAAGGVGPAAVLLMALARDRLVNELAPGAKHLLVNHDLGALLESEPVDVEALHLEAERLMECLEMEDHPAVPAPQAPLELALWPG